MLKQTRRRWSRFDDGRQLYRGATMNLGEAICQDLKICVISLIYIILSQGFGADRLCDSDRCFSFMTPAARGPPMISHSPLASDHAIANAGIARAAGPGS